MAALTPTRIYFDTGGRRFPVSTAGIDDVRVMALGGMDIIVHWRCARCFQYGTVAAKLLIPDLTSPEQQSAAQIAMDSDTDEEPGSADLAIIVTVE